MNEKKQTVHGFSQLSEEELTQVVGGKKDDFIRIIMRGLFESKRIIEKTEKVTI